MQVQPYLFLEGRTEEAIAFYQQALGAKVTALLRYRDSPEPSPMVPPPPGEKVMHANLAIGTTQIMLSDGQCSGTPRVEGIALTVTVDEVAEAERLFAALAEGGQVRMPLTPTFFSRAFGVLADRFGVGWMVVGPAPG